MSCVTPSAPRPRPWSRGAVALVAALLAGVMGPLAAQTTAAPRVDATRRDLGLTARALAPDVYVVEGANADFSPANGCNIINTGFIVTDAGVLVINTGTGRLQGEQLRALIARTTAQPVAQVLHLNLHPDYFLGNQAFGDVPRLATAATRSGMAREAAAYESNLYRLCGDWLKGTEALLPDTALPAMPASGPLRWRLGSREFELHELRGHTDSDLVLIDQRSGVVFAGGLVFSDRVPTTPHADLPTWLAQLDRLGTLLADLPAPTLVPSHGPVRTDGQALVQTRAYLRWLDGAFRDWARQGLEINDVLRAPVPAVYRGWAAFDTEYIRNVTHLFPLYERAAMGLPDRR
jgi:quinoprotein relay system zinc metallohydrolase 1